MGERPLVPFPHWLSCELGPCPPRGCRAMTPAQSPQTASLLTYMSDYSLCLICSQKPKCKWEAAIFQSSFLGDEITQRGFVANDHAYLSNRRPCPDAQNQDI